MSSAGAYALTTKGRILAFISGCDRSPSLREIKDAVGLSSVATVHYHVAALERDGLILRRGAERRIVVSK
jgi:SOS-response transcriptional repressor LexA